MSNSKRLKPPGRNLKVLLGRAAAEVNHGLTGVNMLVVRHDGWCPALVSQTMVAKIALVIAYNARSAQDGRPFMTQNLFGRRLKRLKPILGEAERTMGGKVTHVWLGIGLNEGS